VTRPGKVRRLAPQVTLMAKSPRAQSPCARRQLRKCQLRKMRNLRKVRNALDHFSALRRHIFRIHEG
jgi:hypothetical protein